MTGTTGLRSQASAVSGEIWACRFEMAATGWPEPIAIEQGPASLFGEPDEAWFNCTRTHRYLLTRRWDGGEPMNVIGLNPSTAGAFKSDATIRRVVRFARREGCGWLRMLNIYGLKSTDPGLLREHPDPVGLSNDLILGMFATGLVVAAWGAGGKLNDRGCEVGRRITAAGVPLLCLGTTKDGHPKHPLARGRERVADDAPLIPWEPEMERAR